MTECGIFCPENSQSNTLHCQPATLSTTPATPLLFRARISFITMCKKCARLCHDDTGAAIFHRVSSRSATCVARGRPDLPCSAEGQPKTCCQADSGLCLSPFSFVSNSPRLQPHTGASLKKAALTLLLKRCGLFIFLTRFITFS